MDLAGRFIELDHEVDALIQWITELENLKLSLESAVHHKLQQQSTISDLLSGDG